MDNHHTTTLQEKLSKDILDKHNSDSLYMKEKLFKNGNTHISLSIKNAYPKKKKKDKHLYWISLNEANVLSEIGVPFID